MGEQFNPSAIETYISAKPLQETVSFGDEFAQIVTTPEALCNNLIAAAMQQNVSYEDAQRVASNTSFLFSNIADYIANEARQKELPLPNLYNNIFSKKYLLNTIAQINNLGHGKMNCIFDMQLLVNLIERNKRKDVLLPEKAPKEAKQAALMQGIDAIWRHERQHLIQAMQPEGLEAWKKQEKHAVNIVKIAGGGMLVGVCGETIASALPHTNQLKAPLKVASAVAFELSLASALSTYLYVRKFSPDEKEALAREKSEQIPLASPFQVSFDQ